MSSVKMTTTERRAIISLSSIMGLRMVGLFMVLPVFTLYASQLTDNTPTLIGLAMGIYGLSQALFQSPFGALSDRFGRKPIILMGLIIFAIGSIIAGFADSIIPMIIGRALQGVGAVGSTILAMMADLTTEEQRTKSMAIAGMSIGFSFSVAMFLGPVLTQWLPVNTLFFLAAGFGLIAIAILYTATPTPRTLRWHRDAEPELKSFIKLLADPELAKLNIGIFILHALFTASFMVIPLSLYKYTGLSSHNQWQVYLPTLFIGFLGTLFFIGRAERKQQLKPYFLGGIIVLMLAELLLIFAPLSTVALMLGLCAFFGGFSLLEAFLPSLISRTAPAARKGSALGIYSCSQFLGIFAGGVLGGWLYGKYSYAGVYLFCIALGSIWLILATLMHPPRYLINQMWRLSLDQQQQWDDLAAKLNTIPGMVEVTFIPEDKMAYLKMERETAKHPDLVRLKESL